MADASIRLAVEGGGDFKAAMKAAESSVKLFTTEIKNLATGLTNTSAVQEQTKQKITLLAGASESAKGKVSLLTAEYNKQRDKLNELSKALETASRENGENSAEAIKAEKALNNQTKVVNDLGVKLSNAQKDADNFEKELKDLENQGNKLGSEFNSLDKEVKNVGDGMNDAGQKTLSFKDVLGANIFGNFITQGIQVAVRELQEFVREIIEVGSTYEAQMAKVSAISGAYMDSSGGTLRKLESLTRELSGYFTATEVGQAMEYQAMAGWDIEEIEAATGAILDLAQAGGIDLAKASEIATTGLTAFGMSAEEAGRFADVVAITASSAATDVEGMGETFQKVAPLAGAMGYTIEDMSVAIGLMANNGIKGRKAGTALQNVMTNLAAPTDAVTSAMAELGVTLQDEVTGDMLSFEDVLNQLRDGFAGVENDADKVRLASEIAGKQGMAGLLAIVNSAPDDFQNLSDAINNSTGKAREMAEVMGDTYEGDARRAETATQNLQTAIFELFEGPLRDVKQGFTDFANGLADAIREGSPLIGIIAGIAAGLAAMGIANAISSMGGLVGMVTKLTTAFQGLNAALGVIGLIAAAVTALIVLYNTNEDFRNLVDAVWNKIKEIIGGVVDVLVTFFTETIPNAAQRTIDFFTKDIPEAFNAVITFFAELPGKIGEFLLNALLAVAEWYINMTEKARNTAKDFVVGIGEGLVNLAITIWNKLVEGLTAAAQFVIDFQQSGQQAAEDFFSAIVDGLKALPGEMLKIGKNLIEGLWNGIKEKFEWLKTKIGGVVTGIKNLFTGAKGFDTASPSKWSKKIGVWVMQGLSNGMESETNKVIPKVGNIADRIGDALKTEIEKTSGEIADLQAGITEESAQRELEQYQQTLSEKYAELEKAEVKNRQKIQEEITKLESNWAQKQLDADRKAEQQRLNERLKTLQNYQKEYEKSLADIEKQEESFAKKLSDYGELFTKVKDETGEFLKIDDINEDVRAIERYGEALNSIQFRGISDSLLSEITSLNIDDATAYIGELMKMSDSQYEKYMAAWEEKQNLAKQIASEFYADELEQLSEEMLGTMQEYVDEFGATGLYLMDGVAQGVLDGRSGVVNAVKDSLMEAVAAANAVMDIHSPSRVMEKIGRFMAQGLDVGFVDGMRNTNQDIVAGMLSARDSVTQTGIMQATEAAVNGINVGRMMSGSNQQPVYVSLVLDGRQIAQAVFDPLRNVSKQKGAKL